MWHQEQPNYHQGNGPRQIRPRPQQPQQQSHRHINPPPLMSINPAQIPSMTSVNAPSDCWEDLLDSGQLDVQLQQRLNLGAGVGPQFNKPPPQPHFQPQPGYHYPPPPGPGPPPSSQGNPMFACPPPPINHQQGYPSGMRVQERPLHSQQPQQLPPQRMKILARPAAPSRQPQPQPRPQIHESSRNFHPVPPAPSQPESAPARPQVQIQVAQGENSLQTQYRPPDPVIKIMKRPTTASGDASQENGENAKPKPKTLEQREKEYAQARLRILGSAGTPEPSPPEEEEKESSATNSVKMLRDGNSNSQPLTKNQPPQSGNSVERIPKGPDGSKGFQSGKN